MKKFGALLFVIVIACGKRGDPRPPVPVIPQATSDLVVTQRGTRIVLSWSYPALTTAGRSLTGIRRVVVYRYREELPSNPSAGPAKASDPGVPEAVAQFSTIPTLAAAQFAKLSTRLDSIEEANLTGATVGARLNFEDAPPLRSPSGRPYRYTYAVTTEGETARSDFSNLAPIVPLDVAAAPANLTATAAASGVILKWQTPQRAASGSDAPVIVGYNIYRDTDDLTGELPQPINTTSVNDTTFTDQPPYGEHRYRVTAVAAAGPPRVESDASAPATANFRDLVAPPPPANVSALVETRIVRLVWDPVDAPDLQGYHVYRWQQNIRLKLTTGPTPNTHFGDESVEQGITYHYSITAVDKSGNESAPANSQEFLVPRTP